MAPTVRLPGLVGFRPCETTLCGRLRCARSGRSLTPCRTGQVDPFLPFLVVPDMEGLRPIAVMANPPELPPPFLTACNTALYFRNCRRPLVRFLGQSLPVVFQFLLAARHVRQKSPKISSIERALGKFQKRIYYLMLMASSYRLPRWFEMILVRVRIACYSHHFEAHIAIMTFPLSNAIIPFSSNYSFAIRLNCVLQIVYKYHMTVADISGFNYFLHATLHNCCYKAKRTIS